MTSSSQNHQVHHKQRMCEKLSQPRAASGNMTSKCNVNRRWDPGTEK